MPSSCPVMTGSSFVPRRKWNATPSFGHSWRDDSGSLSCVQRVEQAALGRFDAGPGGEVVGVGEVRRDFREPAGIAELLLALRGHEPVAGVVIAAVLALPIVAQTLVGEEHLVDRALR